MSNKIITSNGFYEITNEKYIEVAENTSAQLFDAGEVSKRIFLKNGAKIEIFGLLTEEENYEIEVVHSEESQSAIFYGLLAKNSTTKARIVSKLAGGGAQSQLDIVSLAAEGGEIDIDGVVDLQKGFQDMRAHLLEENIFLGESGKIRGLPTLLVASNEVEASHGCKIHKISDEKLFYMRSRGVKKEESIALYIESLLQKIFGKLRHCSPECYERVLGVVEENIL